MAPRHKCLGIAEAKSTCRNPRPLREHDLEVGSVGSRAAWRFPLEGHSSLKDYGPVAVEQYPVLGVPAHRTRERPAFHVRAYRRESLGR